ncbi:MAG: hypothetical protein MK211_13320 [Flavobacteriales bacterium]|jgi:hypothetical protein|nr:hypothetical protein [Flavobacteriales bacterium]
MNATIVDVLIGNIKTDQELLEQTDRKIEQAKDEKRTIVDRLKDYRRDISVMLKYADQGQQKKIETLGFNLLETNRGLNPVASFALETVMKAKDNQIENGELYEAYATSCKEKKQEPVIYTEFNIKCQSLLNTQRLLRKKGKDAKCSREDIISLNGQVKAPIEKSSCKRSKTIEKNE